MPIGSTLTVELDVPGSTMAHPPMRDGFDFSWARGTAGEQWPSPAWWICPLTGHLQIRPVQMSTAWPTSTTGAFARPRKSDWDLVDADWAEIEFRAAHDYFLLSRGTNAGISTRRRFPEGQPLWLELRAFATSGDRLEMARITFGQYTLSLYSTGEAKVTGEGLPQEGRTGHITRHPRDISGEFVQLYIQPLGERRICFYSPSHEWGWVLHAPVHRAGPLSVRFPVSQGMLLAMPAVFPAEPVEFVSPVRYLPVAPRPSQVPEIGLDEWDVPSGCGVVASVIEAESDSGISWDGQKRAYRVKYVMLAGTEPGQNPDGRPQWTPTVYGVRIHMPGESAQRTGSPLDVTGDVAELELQFSEGRRGVSGALTLRSGEAYGGSALLHNRLVRIRTGSVPVFLGFANDPARTFGHNPQARRASWQLEGVLALRARTTQMPAHAPFDGEDLEEVVRYLLGLLGASRDEDIELPDLSGLKMPSGTRGSPVCPVEAGQTVEYWLERIEGLFGYAFQERPRGDRWVLRMYHPFADEGDPVKTFYLSDAERQAAGAPRHALAWSYEELGLRPEVNELAIDYCTPEGEHTLMQVIDADAQDPLKPVNERPRNWTGERTWALLRESRIRRDDDIRRMLSALIERPGVMDPVRIAVWTAEWDPDVWPGDRVTVHGRGTFRVTEIGVRMVRDDAVFFHRPASYAGEMRDAG